MRKEKEAQLLTQRAQSLIDKKPGRTKEEAERIMRNVFGDQWDVVITEDDNRTPSFIVTVR